MGGRRGLAVFVCATITFASCALAQATLKGFEYRDAWKAGPWEGNASYDRGKFLGCNAGFSPGGKSQFRLRGLPEGRAPMIVYETDKVDADAFFAAKPQKKRGIVSLGTIERELTVTEVANVWLEMTPDEEIFSGLGGDKRFTLTLEGGKAWTVVLPAETETAVAKWRNCRREHRG